MDLHREIAYRNARLRVYREVYGVPVPDHCSEGYMNQWCISAANTPLLITHCGSCSQFLIIMISGEGKDQSNHPPCPHLSPLLSEDTEEVRAHIGLYLLEAP